MEDQDPTLKLPKHAAPPQQGVSDSQIQNLFAVGAGAFADQPTSPTRGWQPPTVEQLQKALPQYEITALIARGGMGAVYKGTQKTLKRPVAIKVLPPEMEDADMQFAARFKQEAQSMARLSHPNIVAVFDAGEVRLGQNQGAGEEGRGGRGDAETGQGGTLLYFVMEFIEGTDVAQLIASEGRVEPPRAIQIISAVCEALAFAHEEGIVHRDIKPSNIMIDKKGRVKVADFGLAKTVNLDATLLTGTNLAMGTPDFIAPEAMVPGMKVDGRADLYAVGVMLYQMLTGKIPRGRFELPSSVIPQMDKGFDAIVDKAMQTDRENRYSTATEMRQHLDTLLMPAVPAPDLQRYSSAGMPKQAPPASKPGVVTARLPAAAPKPDGRASATPILPSKPRTPLFIGIGATAVMAVGAFVLFDGKKPAPAPQPPTLASQAAPLPPELTAQDASFIILQAERVTAQQLVDAAKTPSTTEPPQSGQRLTATLAPAAMLALKDGITNALGMKFLPVKGTEVMFCIHETRRQDYAAYAAKVPGVDGAWRTQQLNGIPCGDKNDHPVVGVNWGDTQKFCEWLSKEEGRTYRLPTDEEWSIAVGLGLKEKHGKGITPEILNQKDQAEFPWSDDYPPKTKDKAGNYADTAWTENFPSEPGMKDYTDGFPTTAPVMSFKPNQLGLYDMGGNVLEWVEDWSNAAKTDRVLRGASFDRYTRSTLLSSYRLRLTPDTRYNHYCGFRVVLVMR